MSWSVELSFGVDKVVQLHAGSVDVQVGDVENFKFRHEWLGVCAWWEIFEEAYNAFVCFDQWLKVGFGCLFGVGQVCWRI